MIKLSDNGIDFYPEDKSMTVISDEKKAEIKAAANIVDVIGQYVSLKKQGTDYFGLCPFHPENSPSFSVSANKQMYYCFGCGAGGDVFDYIEKTHGKNFQEAAILLAEKYGISLPDGETGSGKQPHALSKQPPVSPFAKGEFKPEKAVQPVQLWQGKAKIFVDWAHEQLLKNSGRIEWLKKRGIDPETVKEFMLGFNPGESGKDIFRPRESWGLDTQYKDDGKTKKKLWIPIGIVIPLVAPDSVIRIRLRTDRDQPKYYVLPGSGMRCMLLGENCRAYVIVESELDGLLVYQECRQNGIGALAIGSSSRKPDVETYENIKKAPVILNALDFDRAGIEASRWWEETLPQTVRWPVPVGKDPGDAFEKGLDIGAWVRTGLPSAWSWKTKGENKGVNVSRTAGRFSSCLNDKGAPPENNSYDKGVIGEFITLVKKSPVTIHVRPDGIKVDCPDNWSSKNWDVLKRISKLVYFEKEISGLLWNMEGTVINCRNVEKVFK